MKGYAKAALRKVVLRFLAVIISLAFLPGCAVVGPLLSVGGMVGLAPLQYASAAYTVGEFSYEYAANDKDPTEVIEAKINNVLSGDAFDLPDYTPGYDSPDKSAETMIAEAEPTKEVVGGKSLVEQDKIVVTSLSVESRQKRIAQILGRRSMQFERLELRRMAFLQAKSKGELSLRQTAMISSPDLFQGAIGETTLR